MIPSNRIVLCLMSVALVLAAAPSVRSAGPRARRVVIVSWDGAPDWAVDRMLAEGKLPNVARLEASGVRAEFSTPAYPSKTACGHASLWTGAFPDVNGVTGNAIPLLPRSEHTILEKRSGFDSAALTAEPLWITAAKAGKRVAVLSATQSYPPDRWVKELRAAGVPDDRYVLFSGFESKVADPAVFDGSTLRPATGWTEAPEHAGEMRELAFTVGDSAFFALVYDDPKDPASGFDSVLVRQGARSGATASAVLKPREAGDTGAPSGPRFRVSKGNLWGFTYFRLWALGADGKMSFYQRGVHAVRGSASPAETEAYVAAYGGFHDDMFGPYEKGALGPQIYAGGDGTAERRVVETVRADAEFLERGTRYAFSRWNPDLLFHYTPMTDSAGHAWVGALDPNGPAYDPALAAKLWPFYEAVFAAEDTWLGDLIDGAGRNSAICLVSDHGMAAHMKSFYPNAVLAHAGLLGERPRPGGKPGERDVDLAKTRACVPPYHDFFVLVNGTDRKGGIVGPAGRDAVLRAASDALLAAEDPETGQRVVTGVFRADDVAGLGTGGEAGGDLYIEVAPGYYPDGRLSDVVVERTDSPIGYGAHGFLPLRRSMQAIFVLGGAGIVPGARLAGVRQIDMAPTLSRLLGIPVPRDARGHVLGEILRGQDAAPRR